MAEEPLLCLGIVTIAMDGDAANCYKVDLTFLALPFPNWTE